MASPGQHLLDGIPWTAPPGHCAVSLRRRCVRSRGLPRLQVSGLEHSRPSLWVKALVAGRRESLAEAPSHRLGSGCTSRPNRLRPRCGFLRPISPAVPVPELLLVLAPRGPGEGCRRGDHGPEHLPCAPREGRLPSPCSSKPTLGAGPTAPRLRWDSGAHARVQEDGPGLVPERPRLCGLGLLSVCSTQGCTSDHAACVSGNWAGGSTQMWRLSCVDRRVAVTPPAAHASIRAAGSTVRGDRRCRLPGGGPAAGTPPSCSDVSGP